MAKACGVMKCISSFSEGVLSNDDDRVVVPQFFRNGKSLGWCQEIFEKQQDVVAERRLNEPRID